MRHILPWSVLYPAYGGDGESRSQFGEHFNPVHIRNLVYRPPSIPYLDAAAQERKPVTWQSTALISHLLGCSRETGPTVTNPVDDPPKHRIVERSEYSVCTMVVRIHTPRAEARMTRFVMLFSCSGVATRGWRCRPPQPCPVMIAWLTVPSGPEPWIT
jgi:hypothetical protein